jgi:hypothetical protein
LTEHLVMGKHEALNPKFETNSKPKTQSSKQEVWIPGGIIHEVDIQERPEVKPLVDTAHYGLPTPEELNPFRVPGLYTQ